MKDDILCARNNYRIDNADQHGIINDPPYWQPQNRAESRSSSDRTNELTRVITISDRLRILISQADRRKSQ